MSKRLREESNVKEGPSLTGNEMVTLFRSEEGQLRCTGDFVERVSDGFNLNGGKFNADENYWFFPKKQVNVIFSLFNVLSKDLPFTVDVDTLLARRSNFPPPPIDLYKPRYAMAGSIVFRIDRRTLNIELRGDINHIKYRLKEAGCCPMFSGSEVTYFQTQHRKGARIFLCMPDEFPEPGVNVDIDLRILGLQQVCFRCLLSL